MAATGTVPWRARAAAALSEASPEAIVLALAVPIIFIHLRYQPKFHVSAGSTSVGVELSDLAVLAVVVAAVLAGAKRGWAPLRRGLALWVAIGVYFVWVGLEILIPHGTAGYPAATHAVTAAKFLEYAFLAPALVLIVRNRFDLQPLVVSFTVWSVLASAVGLAQFFGANIFVSGRTGGRQLSFLGFHDFAALSAGALLLGVAGIVLARLALDRRIAWTAAIAGCVGVILSAAVAAVIGIVLASVALALLVAMGREWHAARAAGAAALVVLALAGALTMRGHDLGHYLGFLETHEQQTNVETYAHRTVLAYIGYRMWRDHPVAGVGWEASGDPSRFLRYVPAARAKYSSEPALAFPTAERRYGVQNFYVQNLADLGAVGLVLLALVFGSGIVLALRGSGGLGATLGLLWILLVAGLWISEGIVAGLPIDALTWLGFGLAARG
ncbi:MAG: O-antigen ligase family protein [Gaiellaceae bacterium]